MAENTLCSLKMTGAILPLAITPNVVPQQGYVSNDALPHIKNKLEFQLVGETLEAFKKFTFPNQTAHKIFNMIKDWDKAIITIPIFNEPRCKSGKISIYANFYFEHLTLLYGNLLWGVFKELSTDTLMDVAKSGFFKLPQFEVILGGVKSTPCALCPNYKQGDVCLYKTRGYQCLFTSGLDVKVDDSEMLSNILSGGHMDLPDASYEEWERNWYENNPDVPIYDEEADF